MGLSEHALQYHMSDWSSCAIWDPYVARDPNPTRMAVSGEKNGFGTKNVSPHLKLFDKVGGGGNYEPWVTPGHQF